MEWAKLGVQVASMVYKSQKDDELHEVRRERDVYKKEAQCLKSHLSDVKKYSNANAYRSKPNTPNYKKDFNKGHPDTSKRGTTAHNQKQFTEKKSYGNSRGGNSRGFGQNNSAQTTQSSSSWFFGFLEGSSSSSNVKTNNNGSSNFSSSSGRGNYSHSRGRGGGRGNGRGRGSFRH